ncbi:unnamed protein product [Symbiodinium sp. CCMP2456]|nr:unnamed protein product [Symbiodinium sp. CCMP2456]
MWKAAMGDRANVMREILTQYEIAPICPYCPQAGDFPGHLPAQKHYQALCNAKLVPGKKIIEISKECYQTWTVPGGILRFNHISGEIAACRGVPPPTTQRALALEGQHLQQALPAFPAAGNQAAVPPEYPTAANPAVSPEYPIAGNPAVPQEYPTAGDPAAFAPGPAQAQIPAPIPVQAQHHPAATPNFGIGPTSAPPQPGETMGAYAGYLAHSWNLEAPPFQPGYQEPSSEVAPGSWQRPEVATGHQEAPVFGTSAQEPAVPSGTFANGFDQGAARHAAAAPAAKTMPSEEQLEFWYWMWRKCVSGNREETKRSLSLMQLAPDELECVMCAVEDFSSIDDMLDHFCSREHFEELVKQSSYPRVPQDATPAKEAYPGSTVVDLGGCSAKGQLAQQAEGRRFFREKSALQGPLESQPEAKRDPITEEEQTPMTKACMPVLLGRQSGSDMMRHKAGACETGMQEPQIQDSPFPTLDVKQLCFTGVLGQGGLAKVGKVRWHKQEFALKFVKPMQTSDQQLPDQRQRDLERLCREATILRECQHDLVVSAVAWISGAREGVMLEFLGPSLSYAHTNLADRLTAENWRIALYSAATALQHVHSRLISTETSKKRTFCCGILQVRLK